MIDFHTHFMPPGVEGYVADACPRFAIESPTCGQLNNGPTHYRTIDDRSWSIARRIVDMDEHAVALQVLSPIPVTSNAYAATVDAALAYARLHNDGIAEAVRSRPDRFAGLGMVPLQDCDAACGELERVVSDLGLHGVEVGTTAAATELDDPRFDEFWHSCDRLAAIVFIHPETAPGFERLRRNGLATGVGYPSETGIVAARMLMGAFTLRYPRVRIVLAHGGGTLPWLLPRLDRVWETTAAVRESLPERPSRLARDFYCDTMTFDVDNLNLVIDRFGVERVMVGSDYPMPIAEFPPGRVLDQATALVRAAQDALRFGNARRLLDDSPSSSGHS